MEQEKKLRMLLLLRNSTKKQAEKIITDDGRTEYDIPLQRSILRPWAERLGYDIVGELVEGGVSGYKISADQRDAVIEIKAKADRGEFDVLGIYMSDRLGRIADETPLIVSFLNARGIKVLSYADGEISAKTHNDKLMTYIRFWQAEGESLKTSIRIKDANEKGVEAGKWRGGCPPYGYKTVSRGTLNFKGKPIFDVEIDPEAAENVKRIFRLYKEHNSTKRIARILNDAGAPTREGGLWGAGSVVKILKNKQYLGLYELGKASGNVRVVSPIMEHLRILDEETFYEVQEMIAKSKTFGITVGVGKRPTIRGAKMLTGLLYCECGKKYTAHTQTYRKQRQDGSEWIHECSFYRCGSHRHPIEGQCAMKPFNADKLERIITDDAKKFLLQTDIEKLLIDHEDKIRGKEAEITEQMRRMTKDLTQKERELAKLKDEVYKAIIGESQFSQSLLSELIQTKEKELLELKKKYDEAEARADDLRKSLQAQRAVCSDLSNWAARFDLQETAEKKGMLINLIDKITMFEEEIDVRYSIRFDSFEENEYNERADGGCDAEWAFLYSEFAQRDTQARTWGWPIPTRST